ncbi:MAG TPA: TetR/AcrR family transcriptional regulator [Solirubrobacteraceae bacterium]|nr:TetR/AcrR family transcriptional regulator [Solirubrobacteraceae bacterium]
MGPGRAERRKAETRRRLIDAGRVVFAEKGVDAAAIAEITEAADVGFGTFYNHFQSKQELAAAVIVETLAAEGAALRACAATLEDPAELVAVAHRHFIRRASADSTWAWLIIRLDRATGALADTLSEYALGDLQSGVRAGRFALGEVLVLKNVQGGALVGAIRGMLAGETTPEETEHAHAQAMLQLLGIPPSEAREIAWRPLPRGVG